MLCPLDDDDRDCGLMTGRYGAGEAGCNAGGIVRRSTIGAGNTIG